MTHEEIAAVLKIDDETLVKHYAHEISCGKAMVDMFVADAFMKGVANGDTALIKYYMNNQMGFKEKADVTVENNISFATLAVPEINRRLASFLTGRPSEPMQALSKERPVLSIDGDSRPG